MGHRSGAIFHQQCTMQKNFIHYAWQSNFKFVQMILQNMRLIVESLLMYGLRHILLEFGMNFNQIPRLRTLKTFRHVLCHRHHIHCSGLKPRTTTCPAYASTCNRCASSVDFFKFSPKKKLCVDDTKSLIF